MEDSKEIVIVELVKALTSIKEKNLQIHKKLLIESQATNKIYIQILSELRRQNLILEDLKESGKVTVKN